MLNSGHLALVVFIEISFNFGTVTAVAFVGAVPSVIVNTALVTEAEAAEPTESIPVIDTPLPLFTVGQVPVPEAVVPEAYDTAVTALVLEGLIPNVLHEGAAAVVPSLSLPLSLVPQLQVALPQPSRERKNRNK